MRNCIPSNMEGCVYCCCGCFIYLKKGRGGVVKGFNISDNRSLLALRMIHNILNLNIKCFKRNRAIHSNVRTEMKEKKDMKGHAGMGNNCVMPHHLVVD